MHIIFGSHLVGGICDIGRICGHLSAPFGDGCGALTDWFEYLSLWGVGPSSVWGQARRSRRCRPPSAHNSAADMVRWSDALRQFLRSRRLSIRLDPEEVGHRTKSLRDSPLKRGQEPMELRPE